MSLNRIRIFQCTSKIQGELAVPPPPNAKMKKTCFGNLFFFRAKKKRTKHFEKKREKSRVCFCQIEKIFAFGVGGG